MEGSGGERGGLKAATCCKDGTCVGGEERGGQGGTMRGSKVQKCWWDRGLTGDTTLTLGTVGL